MPALPSALINAVNEAISELRLELGVIQEHRRAIENNESRRPLDAITFGALSAIDKISDRLEHHLQRDLIFAPIWAPDDVAEILERITSEKIRKPAKDAYSLLQRITGPGQKYGVFHRDRADLESVLHGLECALEATDALTEESEELCHACYYLRMETCFVELLLTRLLPKEKRDASLRTLVARYLEIVTAFPDAAIPHFRLNVIHAELQEPEPEARHLARAMELIDREPLRIGPSHWVRSTMLRRKCAELFNAAILYRDKARHDHELANRYVDLITKATVPLLEGFDPDASSLNELDALERHRRLNNIVFYMSHIFEVHPFGVAPFTPEQFDALRDRLVPDGIERVLLPGVVHTIAFAYEVRGERDKLKAAGQHLKLLVLASETEDVEADRQLLKDAENWLGNVSWSVLPQREKASSLAV